LTECIKDDVNIRKNYSTFKLYALMLNYIDIVNTSKPVLQCASDWLKKYKVAV